MSSFESIPYTDGPTALTGLVARPAEKPRDAIVVSPTIMNQAPNALRRLPMLAEAGYLAFCADHRQSRAAMLGLLTEILVGNICGNLRRS